MELSLLIILICFCFNCFSGSLFTPRWNLQIPRCHPQHLRPQKAADWTRPSPIEVISTACLPRVPSRHPPSAATTSTSLLCPCPGLGSPIWSQGFGFSLEIFFSSHFLNIPTQHFPFLSLLRYQSLSGASNFQAKTTNLTNWNYGSGAEKTQFVRSEKYDFKSLCKLCDCKLPATVPANHVTWACYLISLGSCFHSCKMVKIISTWQDCFSQYLLHIKFGMW